VYKKKGAEPGKAATDQTKLGKGRKNVNNTQKCKPFGLKTRKKKTNTGETREEEKPGEKRDRSDSPLKKQIHLNYFLAEPGGTEQK